MFLDVEVVVGGLVDVFVIVVGDLLLVVVIFIFLFKESVGLLEVFVGDY